MTICVCLSVCILLVTIANQNGKNFQEEEETEAACKSSFHVSSQVIFGIFTRLAGSAQQLE